MLEVLTEIASLPAMKELLSIDSPISLIAPMFFLTLCLVPVCATYATLRYQAKAIYRAITTRRSAVLFVEPYTQAILSDTCTELRKLRGTYAPSGRVELLKTICNELESEVASSPLSLSLLRQFQAYLTHESKLLRSEQRKPQVIGDDRRYYVGSHRGSA